MEIPAVSVIIPLYNAEKYIGECLDSILAQTFQNFEVIVVDDCSTDNSVAVVKGYVEKFGGRLKLSKTKKNTGGAGIPRNKGMELSRGEYLSFVDPDDTIMPTAFEKLYSAAKNFNADVVQSEKWYQLPDEFYNDTERRKNLKPYSWPTKEKVFITQPTLLTTDFEKRITDFSKGWLTWSVCLQLVKRDFIFNNEIKFANVHAEDMVFTMCEICCAEKYLVIPNTFYLYRLREGSAIRESFDVPKLIHKYSLTLKYAIKYLDEFFGTQEIFSKQTHLKYILFEMFMSGILNRLNNVYRQVPAHKLDNLLRAEYNEDKALSSLIFNSMCIYRLQLMQSKQKAFQINTLNDQAQKRIAELENEIKRLKGED